MRISDWSADVCSSDLLGRRQFEGAVSAPIIEDKLSARIAGFSLHTRGAYQNLTTGERANGVDTQAMRGSLRFTPDDVWEVNLTADYSELRQDGVLKSILVDEPGLVFRVNRSEEHTYELQSLML